MDKAQYYTKLFNEIDGCITVTDLTCDLHTKDGRIVLSLIAKVWDMFIVNPDKAFKEFALEFSMIREGYARLPKITR